MARLPVAKQVESEPSSDSEPGVQSLGEYVAFPACGIKMRRPEGFEKSPPNERRRRSNARSPSEGFENLETLSSVFVIAIEQPYLQFINDLMHERDLKARGWSVLGEEDVQIDGRPGMLAQIEKTLPSTQGEGAGEIAESEVNRMWVLVFGDDERTYMAIATFPLAHEGELSARLKAALLSTRIDPVAISDTKAD